MDDCLPKNMRNLESQIVKLLLELKELTDVEYPPYLHDPRRAAYLQQITTKKVGIAGTTPTRQ